MTARQAEPPMEFACEFVYIPTSANQKEGQRSLQNVIKRSALLPPINKVRPRTPPPLPPAKATELERPRSFPSTQKFIETLEKEDDVGKAAKPSPCYENASFLRKEGAAAAGGGTVPQQTTSTRKTDEPRTTVYPWDPNYSYNNPECTGGEAKPLLAAGHSVAAQKTAPPLPPRPEFMKSIPEYLVLLPASATPSSSSQKSPSPNPITTAPTGLADKGPLLGNPNVILVSLGKLLTEENEENGYTILGEPTLCSQCGSVLDFDYDNVISECYFCQSWEPPNQDSSPKSLCTQNICPYGLFLLNPRDTPVSPADALLLFCIDISGSMSMTSQVSDGEQVVYRSRLQFVQEAVLQSVQRLSQQQPDVRLGLITFNNQVMIHGYREFTSHFLSGAELIDSEYLKETAFSLPSPPPLHRTRDSLQREVLSLCESGATALGPAALVAIAMASRQPGSKVIICTDGKANTELGNLEVEDSDSRTLTSSTIFYQDLGEYAAMQGVTVSVLTIEGTDCRLDELGRLADRTGGKVVIASPHKLHTEFEEIIENRTIATHCSVTLLLPRTLHMIGERETGHKAMREVGNVSPNTEITFQFGAKQHSSEAPAPGSRVSVQLQVRYRRRDTRRILRVFTVDREVTDDSWAALSSLSLAIIQLNSSQASAALAVRGRFLDAQREAETQRKLIERALEHNHRREDKQIYSEWVKTMEPIYDGIQSYTRRNSVVSDVQSLTDTGAALLYTMKHSNRKSISLKDKHRS
ncbi:circularly permutated Ras protein 1-like [Lampris incognitus]|uniref:circularly permutated Ras protein 1-like n=1 Tax=Lampris incognitus TaxID=2546036 RepID=UPI0024B4A3D2|nr:circularly permutated Ras protein 1-like [Lampris incognitus]